MHRRGARPGSSSGRSGLAHDLLGVRPAQPVHEQEGDPLGHDEAAGQIEVLAHAGGVDLERLERACEGVQRTAGVRQRAGQSGPLGLPGAGRALVLLFERPDEHAGMSRGEPCIRACERRADRVALLRHRRGTSRAPAFGHLADLGLGEQDEVEARSSRRHRQRSRARRRARRCASGSCATASSAPAGRAPARSGRAARSRRRRTRRASRPHRRAVQQAVPGSPAPVARGPRRSQSASRLP